jgi:hypothetical protein
VLLKKTRDDSSSDKRGMQIQRMDTRDAEHEMMGTITRI